MIVTLIYKAVHMNKLLLFFGISLILVLNACSPKEKYPTPTEIEAEKQAIIKVINDYNRANENENFSEIVETLANEVVFFGTDSAEVIKTIADYKEAIIKQWDEYDSMKYYDLKDVSIFMDDKATWATIYFGMPADLSRNNVKQHYYLRGSRTLKKEDGKWHIASGTLGIVRSHIDEKNAYSQDSVKTQP